MFATSIVTTQAILDALRPEQTAVAWQTHCEQTQIDWNDLIVRAIVLGLAPQLHHQLASWELSLPATARARLLVTYKAQQQRNAAIYRQLDELLAACQMRQLQPIALKGVHLATLCYAEPALRPMNDIDLLFTPAQLPAAEALLADLGYGGKHKAADSGAGVTKHTSTFRRADGSGGATPNPYLSTSSDRMVEPHTSLEESWFGLKVDITPGVHERAQTAVLSQQPCLVLAPEDLLLHICLHLCFHLIQGAPAMVQLSDVLAITRAGGIDWSLFVRRACEQHAAPYALAALTLGQKLLSAPVPVAVWPELAQATPRALRQRVAGLGLEDILRRTQQKPLITLHERILRGFADRAETARWAPDWRGRWQVWRTLLQPGRSDTGQMLLTGKKTLKTNIA